MSLEKDTGADPVLKNAKHCPLSDPFPKQRTARDEEEKTMKKILGLAVVLFLIAFSSGAWASPLHEGHAGILPHDLGDGSFQKYAPSANGFTQLFLEKYLHASDLGAGEGSGLPGGPGAPFSWLTGWRPYPHAHAEGFYGWGGFRYLHLLARHHHHPWGDGQGGGEEVLPDAPSTAPVPIPAPLLLFGTGLGFIGLAGKKRQVKNS
jgi:hypothetical protein